jgi:hypothetical protein
VVTIEKDALAGNYTIPAAFGFKARFQARKFLGGKFRN